MPGYNPSRSPKPKPKGKRQGFYIHTEAVNASMNDMVYAQSPWKDEEEKDYEGKDRDLGKYPPSFGSKAGGIEHGQSN